MSTRVPPGGPAAIHGFLYQVLSNLAHVARAKLQEHPDASGGSLTIVLEPNAGDAQLRTAGRGLIVEQYKTRSGGRTWSLADITGEVLPDLLKAVPVDPDPGSPSPAYRFVTDGRADYWDNFLRVCRQLAAEPSSDAPGSRLDDAAQVRFFNTPTDCDDPGKKQVDQTMQRSFDGSPTHSSSRGRSTTTHTSGAFAILLPIWSCGRT